MVKGNRGRQGGQGTSQKQRLDVCTVVSHNRHAAPCRREHMRTTVTLEESLVAELLQVTGRKTKTAAVKAAIKEQIRRARLKQLAGLLGRLELDEEALARSREVELARAEWLAELGVGTGNAR
jgi:Arc/MetJ family transcription regulator